MMGIADLPVANAHESAAADHWRPEGRTFGLDVPRWPARPALPPARVMVGRALSELALILAVAFVQEGIPCDFVDVGLAIAVGLGRISSTLAGR